MELVGKLQQLYGQVPLPNQSLPNQSLAGIHYTLVADEDGIGFEHVQLTREQFFAMKRFVDEAESIQKAPSQKDTEHSALERVCGQVFTLNLFATLLLSIDESGTAFLTDCFENLQHTRKCEDLLSGIRDEIERFEVKQAKSTGE